MSHKFVFTTKKMTVEQLCKVIKISQYLGASFVFNADNTELTVRSTDNVPGFSELQDYYTEHKKH